MTEVIKLACEGLELDVCPAGGGCITAFRAMGQDLMRPADAAYWNDLVPNHSSCYPLVPYSNRIVDGRLTFEGRSYQLPINSPSENHAIHGDGWLGSWTVLEADDRSLLLRFAHRIE